LYRCAASYCLAELDVVASIAAILELGDRIELAGEFSWFLLFELPRALRRAQS
jgi:hypothetical protein